MKNKHYDLILQWAEGAEIEYFSKDGNEWRVSPTPLWNENSEYRIKPARKPARKPDYEKTFSAVRGAPDNLFDLAHILYGSSQSLTATFDGETDNIIAVKLA